MVSVRILVTAFLPFKKNHSFSIRSKMFFFAPILLFFAMFWGPTSARANDIYIAQNAAGVANGSSCANALPVSFFNSSSNWGIGTSQIGPGTAVHLCGTVGTTLVFAGNGASGSPVTLFFEIGAKISTAASDAIHLNGHSWIVIDGNGPRGTNGILENTANGSGLSNHLSTKAIEGSGASNIEVKNLLIQNFYVHASASDSAVDATLDTCYYANGTKGPVSFHDNQVHDVGWCLEFQGYGTNNTINVFNNYLYNYDHGITIAVNNTTDSAAVNIYNNHFGTTSNWDTTVNAYHHDGIHIYNNASAWAPGWSFNVYNNLFDGNWGINNTAHIFTEEHPPSLTLYNNVFLQAAGNMLNNGFVNACGNNCSLYNNTFLGSGVTLSQCINLQVGSNQIFRNNVVTGCNTFVGTQSGATFAAGGLSNNIYAAVGPGGNPPFKYEDNTENNFGNWQSATGQDGSPSLQVSSANLGTTGIPQSSSAVNGAGADLCSTTSLCASYSALAWDTSAGNSRTPQGRPTSGAWTVGAYNYPVSSGSLPAAPTGLVATVN